MTVTQLPHVTVTQLPHVTVTQLPHVTATQLPLTVAHEAVLPNDLSTHVTCAWATEASELELVTQDTWKGLL